LVLTLSGVLDGGPRSALAQTSSLHGLSGDAVPTDDEVWRPRAVAITAEAGTIAAAATTADTAADSDTAQRPIVAPPGLDLRLTPARAPRRTDVLAAFADSLKLLAFEHSIRIAFQEKTRRELDGPFWRDYRQSVRTPDRWEDSDAWWVNYIGHPIHGAAAGYAWIDHGPEAPREIDMSTAYWAGRARALAWTAGYSLQFEFGPLSEASIGNVGLRPETTGWVDHVVTPVGAFGLIVAEDALDRYFVKWAEARTRNRFFRATLRLAFNPARTMSNSLRGRVPWHREGRPLGWSR
jgi:hypothetical protein